MKGCKNLMKPWWLQLSQRQKSYVFARLKIRDREVGGSNPLAPTIYFQSTYGRQHWRLVFLVVADLWQALLDEGFPLNTLPPEISDASAWYGSDLKESTDNHTQLLSDVDARIKMTMEQGRKSK